MDREAWDLTLEILECCDAAPIFACWRGAPSRGGIVV